jgi:hypothetical protein
MKEHRVGNLPRKPKSQIFGSWKTEQDLVEKKSF